MDGCNGMPTLLSAAHLTAAWAAAIVKNRTNRRRKSALPLALDFAARTKLNWKLLKAKSATLIGVEFGRQLRATVDS